MKFRLCLVLAITLSALVGPVARADRPTHDDMANAMVIDSLPLFAHNNDMREATLEAGEPKECLDSLWIPMIESAPKTVWYRHTATTSQDLAAVGFGFYGADITVAVYRIGGTGLEHVACHSYHGPYDEKGAVFAAENGETYMIQVGKSYTGSTQDPTACCARFQLRAAPTTDLAITDVEAWAEDEFGHSQSVEVEVTNLSPGSSGRGTLTVVVCPKPDVPGEAHCWDVSRSSGYESMTSCDPCTRRYDWYGELCAGDIVVRARVDGLDIVDPDPSNNIATTETHVLASLGAGACANA